VQLVNSLRNLWCLNFRHLSAHGAYLVAMAVALIAGFIFCGALKTMPDDQTQFHKQIQGVVERGS
jgi:hypothetical protein